MKQWKLIAGVAIVFALGILAGSLGTGLLFKYRVIRPARMEPSEKKAMILKKYSKALSLSPDQITGFKAIIDDMDTNRRDMFKKVRPEMRKMRQQGEMKMKALLTPEQKDKLDQLHQEFRKRFKKKRGYRY